jgi:hypothetical protein
MLKCCSVDGRPCFCRTHDCVSVGYVKLLFRGRNAFVFRRMSETVKTGLMKPVARLSLPFDCGISTTLILGLDLKFFLL